MWRQFSEQARRVVSFAQEEAASRGTSDVDTGHLLLGLLRESDTIAAWILARLDAWQPERIREALLRQMTPGVRAGERDMQLTGAAKRAIDLACDEARSLRHRYIGTEHLLLGLLGEREGPAARVLSRYGVDVESVRRERSALDEEGPGPGAPTERPPQSLTNAVTAWVGRLFRCRS